MERDLERREFGTYSIQLAAAGRQDPLLEDFPPAFAVQLGHQDFVAELPPGVVGLASSDLCQHQIIRVEGQPAYGTQFHSEMTHEDMRGRLAVYGDYYFDSAEERQAFEAGLASSREADTLLDRFLTLYT